MDTRARSTLSIALGMWVGGWLVPAGVRAAGVEDTVTGAVALGRSANYVRVDDYMAVWQNPANLSLIDQRNAGLELRLPIFRGCFERYRDPALANATPSEYLATESFDEVCNDGGIGLAGGGGFAMALPRGFGFGVGLYSPGGVPHTKYGSAALNTLSPSPSDTVPGTSGVRESPNRFLLVERNVVAAFLMAGLGYQPNRFVRFGVSGGGGAVGITYKNVTSAVAPLLRDQGVVADVQVADMFVPRATVSAVASPLPSLELMATFTWTGDIEAKGTVDVTANGYTSAPRGDCLSSTPGTRCRVDDVTLKVPFQRYEAVIGARYAQARRTSERARDPMRDEVWDIEIDGYWSQTSHVEQFVLQIHDGAADPSTPIPQVNTSSAPTATPLQLPATAAMYHGWKDTLGVRLGGDYNVLPERLAVRAGLAYETAGADKKNLSLDYWPVQKVTISLGATVAISRFRLSLGYAHVFHQTADVKLGEGNIREIAAQIPPGQQARVVNEGRYSAALDVFSLQANVRF